MASPMDTLHDFYSEFEKLCADVLVRRFNSEMQQAVINGMAERRVGKAGGVKGLSPKAMRA